MTNLLNVLQHLPELVNLGVEDAMTPGSTPSGAIYVPRGPVHLQMASRVALVEPMGTCAVFLREVVLPWTCSVFVTHDSKKQADVVAASDAVDEFVGPLITHLQLMCGGGPLDTFELNSEADPGRGSDMFHLSCTAAEGHTLRINIFGVGAELLRRIDAPVLAALSKMRTRKIMCKCTSQDAWLPLWSSFTEPPYATAPGRYTNIQDFTIRMLSKVFFVSVKQPQINQAFLVSLSGRAESVSQSEMLATFLHGLRPFQDLESVTIDIHVSISSALWERACELFNAAEVLHVYGRSSLRPIKLLGQRLAPSWSFPFPKLRTLVLHYADMGSVRQTTFEELKKTLTIRQDKHTPVQNLELEFCHSLSDEGELALNGLVNTLILTKMAAKEDPYLHLPYHKDGTEEDWSDQVSQGKSILRLFVYSFGPNENHNQGHHRNKGSCRGVKAMCYPL